MLRVAKKFRKVQVTVRVNPLGLSRLDRIGEMRMKNRSEMIDLAIEEYVRSHVGELADVAGGADEDVTDVNPRIYRREQPTTPTPPAAGRLTDDETAARPPHRK
jgi:hypothetical protein